jgi:hypothetical protein
MGTGKEAQRETQERRYKGEGTSKKDNETLQIFKSLRPILAWSVANTYRMKCVTKSHN